MFHSLIRVFHDGIILTQGEDIVFQNKQVSQIYSLLKAGGTGKLKESLVEALKATQEERSTEMSKEETVISHQVAHDNEAVENRKSKNVWEYIVNQEN
jgi:hypothetical protein